MANNRSVTFHQAAAEDKGQSGCGCREAGSRKRHRVKVKTVTRRARLWKCSRKRETAAVGLPPCEPRVRVPSIPPFPIPPGVILRPHPQLIAADVFCIELQPCGLLSSGQQMFNSVRVWTIVFTSSTPPRSTLPISKRPFTTWIPSPANTHPHTH